MKSGLPSEQSMSPAATVAGFTLLEALVAFALLAFVVIQFLGTRTEALIDSAEARNWRIAREIAERELSAVLAGARELPPKNRDRAEVEHYTGFSFEFAIGEAAIAQLETDLTATAEEDAPPGSAGSMTDRLEWQRERDTLRRAESLGLSYTDYQDQLLTDRPEDKPPTEDDMVDVAVVVYFPNVRPSEDATTPETSTFVLKAKVSTMALQCLTPDQAEVVAKSRGEAGSTGGVSGAPTGGSSEGGK
jgi:type II secretory pathway component PulJ